MKEKYNQIIYFLQDYLDKSKCEGYVINISGGKDSTIVAKLLVDAVGCNKVLGILQPNGTQIDIDDSINVCNLLNINYIKIDIQDTFKSIISSIEKNHILKFNKDLEEPKVTYRPLTVSNKAKTNIAPRIRMLNAYAIAQTLNYLVVGTGNKSERFIGWFTKWGDGACDINPIAHLTCSEVIELGDYLGLPYDLVHKTPADGLTGKSDEENLGFTYEQLDTFINKFEKNMGSTINRASIIEQKMLLMSENSFHKFAPKMLK